MERIRVIFEKDIYCQKHIDYMILMLIYMEKAGAITEKDSYETNAVEVHEYELFLGAYKFLKYMEEYDMFRIEKLES